AAGVWSTGFLLGSVTGPLFGGGLVAVSLRAPFLVYAAALVVTAVVTGLLLRRSAIAGPPGEDGVPVMTLREALRRTGYRAGLLANFAKGWVALGVRVSLVPLFVVEVLHREPSWAGVALTVFAVGNAATLLFAGRWADRRGRKPPLLFGLAVTSV